MEKIDFFGGTHGHFLELVLNLFVYRIEFPINDIFSSNGACHQMLKNANYHPMIKCNHYSQLNHRFEAHDRVIEIYCNEEDMLPALVNSFVRAGDESIDICQLEIDTVQKLYHLPKAKKFLEDLVNEHGLQKNYSRSVIRNYFYAKFDVPEYGIRLFNKFTHKHHTHAFPFSAFYNLQQFYLELNRCAFFLNMDFFPSENLNILWQQFIEINQGYHSQLRCNQIIHCVLTAQDMTTSNLNLIEEAWILYKISKIFRCYDHPELNCDDFPKNTKDIAQILQQWKATC